MSKNLQEDMSEVSAWEFPTVVTDEGASGFFRSFDDEIELDQPEFSSPEESSSDAEENEVINNQYEIDNLRMAYESKIVILNELLTKLKNPVSIVDEEVIDILQDIIRKVVKKIIQKEIEQDNQLILKMIDEFHTLLQDKGGMVNVYISESDYSKITDAQHQANLTIHSKADLQQGDIIVKSNFTEIRALLNERIEQLIRIQHE